MVHEAQWVRRVDRRLEAPAAAADLDGLTIVQLSDFHVGFRPSFNLRATRKAVDMALAARPDLVLVTGDFACGPHGRAELHGGGPHLHARRPVIEQTNPAGLDRARVGGLHERRLAVAVVVIPKHPEDPERGRIR